MGPKRRKSCRVPHVHAGILQLKKKIFLQLEEYVMHHVDVEKEFWLATWICRLT